MNEELIMTVDENNTPISVSTRSKAIKEGLWRRASGGILIDINRNKVLTHQRSDHKDERASLWVCTFGGKIGLNEDPSKAASRELEEELGVIVSPSTMKFQFAYKSTDRTQYEYVYSAEVDSESQSISVDPNEVMSASWLCAQKVIDELHNNLSWYNYGYEIDLLKSVFKKY